MYLALDGGLPGFPDGELALLWDLHHGWSAAIETRSGQDLTVLARLGFRHGVVPPPDTIVRWITKLRTGSCPIEQFHSSALSTMGRHRTAELLNLYRDPAASGRIATQQPR
jgi:hypothetical protein